MGFLEPDGRDQAAKEWESIRLQGFACMAKVIKAAMAADRVAEIAPVPNVWIEAVEAASAELDGCAVHGAGCCGDEHYTEAGADLMRQLLDVIPVLVEGGSDYDVEWLPIGKGLVPRFRFKEPLAA